MSSKLTDLYKLCLGLGNHPLAERLHTLSQYFLDTNYGQWADGSTLESLDDFTYRLDTLDCVTFVEVVLALAKTEPLPDYDKFVNQFERVLRLIHYANGQPNFISRNHFTSVDWILNNKFIVEDITANLTPNHKIAEALIDKLTWIKRHKINQGTNVELTAAVASRFQPQISRLPYIETLELLNNQQKFYEIFPEYSIVNIVRPNWDLREKIGTHLNVSHVGFAFKDLALQTLTFYHASTEKLHVVQDTLFDYMGRHKDSPTIRGINVLVISPGYYTVNG